MLLLLTKLYTINYTKITMICIFLWDFFVLLGTWYDKHLILCFLKEVSVNVDGIYFVFYWFKRNKKSHRNTEISTELNLPSFLLFLKRKLNRLLQKWNKKSVNFFLGCLQYKSTELNIFYFIQNIYLNIENQSRTSNQVVFQIWIWYHKNILREQFWLFTFSSDANFMMIPNICDGSVQIKLE